MLSAAIVVENGEIAPFSIEYSLKWLGINCTYRKPLKKGTYTILTFHYILFLLFLSQRPFDRIDSTHIKKSIPLNKAFIKAYGTIYKKAWNAKQQQFECMHMCTHLKSSAKQMWLECCYVSSTQATAFLFYIFWSLNWSVGNCIKNRKYTLKRKESIYSHPNTYRSSSSVLVKLKDKNQETMSPEIVSPLRIEL